jgi:hypothetical protein
MSRKFTTNSDHKSRQQFEVLDLTGRSEVEGIQVGGRKIKYGDKSRAAVIDDAGLAKDIQQRYGQAGTRDCLVVPVEKPRDELHERTFQGVRLPWHNETFKFGEGNRR